MNFFTAYVAIEVDDSKLKFQLDKVKNTVTKVANEIEKRFGASTTTIWDRMATVAGYSLKAITFLFKRAFIDISDVIRGSFRERFKDIVGSFRETLWEMHKVVVGAKLEKLFSATLTAGAKAFLWPLKAITREMKFLGASTKLLADEKLDKKLQPVTEEMKKLTGATEEWRAANFLSMKEFREGFREGAGTVTVMRDSIEELRVSLGKISAAAEARKFVNYMPGVEVESKWVTSSEKPYSEEWGFMGEMLDVSSVVVLAYQKMFTVITGVFRGIVSSAESMFDKVFRITSLRTVSILAMFTGMYFKITQAAMDSEDALSFAEKGSTRQALQQLRETLEGIAAAMGKPFLNSIRVISSALSEWLEKNQERFAAWSGKVAGYVSYIRTIFVAWVKYLSTDWRGGIKVATDIVVEIFKGLGESIVMILSNAGKKAGLALVKGLVGGVAGAAASETERATGLIERILKKLMKSSEESWKRLSRYTGIPGGQDTLLPFTPSTRFRTRTTEEQESEGLSKRLLRIAKDRAVNIKQLLEGMPAWMPPSTEIEVSAKAVMEADTAMAEHRKRLLEQGGTLSEMQYRNDVDRITRRMEAESQAAREIEEVWKEMEDRRIEREWHEMRAPIIEAERLSKEIADRNKRIAEDYAYATANAWTNAFMKMATEGQKFGDAMKEMFQELLSMIMRIIVYKKIAEPIAYGMMGLPVPSAQHGGTVMKTGLAVIHKGETYSGVGGGGGGGITINVSNVPAGYTFGEEQEYMVGDQRIIDVSMQAASGDGAYMRAHNLR